MLFPENLTSSRFRGELFNRGVDLYSGFGSILESPGKLASLAVHTQRHGPEFMANRAIESSLILLGLGHILLDRAKLIVQLW